jgi:alkylhydroperoxidase family enzyme
MRISLHRESPHVISGASLRLRTAEGFCELRRLRPRPSRFKSGREVRRQDFLPVHSPITRRKRAMRFLRRTTRATAAKAQGSRDRLRLSVAALADGLNRAIIARVSRERSCVLCVALILTVGGTHA